MKKRNFSAEFKRESAQLVVDQNYTVADAAKAMDVGLSTMTRWVKQLRDERQGKTPKASPITPEQIEIRELRKKLQRIEMENEILKKATSKLHRVIHRMTVLSQTSAIISLCIHRPHIHANTITGSTGAPPDQKEQREIESSHLLAPP